jgi:hypothetical protein
MQPKFTEAELNTVNNWMRTDTGKKLLEIIHATSQGYLDEAMIGIAQGANYTHDRVVAAQAIDTIYQWLKPPEPKKEEPGEDD